MRHLQLCRSHGAERVHRTAYDEPVVDLVISGVVAGAVVALWLTTKHWVFVDVLGVCLASEAIKVDHVAAATTHTHTHTHDYLSDCRALIARRCGCPTWPWHLACCSRFSCTTSFGANLRAGGAACINLIRAVSRVFISPLLFGQSVMVEVAMGVSGSAIPLPLLLQIPKVLFDGGAGLLGLGDIVLPGVLLAKLFRVDVSRARSGLRAKHVQRDLSLFEVLAMERGSYFVPALCAYVVGLVITLAALAVLQMGQPGRVCVRRR